MIIYKWPVTTLFVLLILAVSAAVATPYQGYTFYASGSTAYLADMDGNTVHTWKGGGTAVCVAYLLEDGSVLFPLNNNCSTRSDGAHPSGRIQRISWDGTVAWDYKYCPSDYGPGYDIEPMPNGNILLPADNSSSAGIIYEIKPSGASGGDIVWQFALPDSLNSSGSMGGGTYINSVSYNPDLDMILVDLQEPVRKLVVIDHSQATGKIVFTYTVATSGRLHGAVWSSPYYMGTKIAIPDADTAAMHINNLLVVHNTSEVVEVNMATKSKVKSLTYSFANNEGSVQRLPNGNTLVQKGMDQTTIAELDSNGVPVATITAKGRCSRAYRYGPDFPGVANLKVAAGQGGMVVRKGGDACRYDAHADLFLISLATSNGQPVHIRIHSITGKLVTVLTVNENVPFVSTRDMAPGMYFVDIRHGAGSFNASFVKM